MNQQEKIKFGDLNVWLKIAIILAWISGIITGITFLSGFLAGLLGV